MLKAMKEQLKFLAKDEEQIFHKNLRKAVGKKATDILEERLKKVIVLMPDLVMRIHDYWRMQPDASPTKRLGSYMLTYIYLPKDFLPQDKYGLYGYLDDAYVVAKIYTTVIEDVQKSTGVVIAMDKDLYEEVKMLKKSIRLVIPTICQKIDGMIDDLSVGKNESFVTMVEENQF